MISLIPTYWCFSLESAELWRLNVVIKIYEDNHCGEKIRKKKRRSRKKRGMIMAPIEAALAAVMYKYKRSRVEVSIVKVPGPLSPHVSGVICVILHPHSIASIASITFTNR